MLALTSVAFAVRSTAHDASAAKNARKTAFVIRGGVKGQFRPGVTLPFEMSIVNLTTRKLWINRLKVMASTDLAHRSAGCTFSRHFKLAQLPKKAFPIVVPRSTKRALKRKLGAPARSLQSLRVKYRPTITMLNHEGVNQDECKGAKITLRFVGNARDKKKR